MEYKRLSDCAFWGKDRTDNINYESYISTENMIKDKGGVTIASSLPDSKTASAYDPMIFFYLIFVHILEKYGMPIKMAVVQTMY